MTEIKTGNRWRVRLIRYAPLFLWVLVILGFSTEQASAEQTSRIIRPILEFFFPNSAVETIDLYHAYIRKLAHLTEYGILAFFACRALAGSSIGFLRRQRFIIPLLLALTVASTDEYHQSFEASRTGSPWDVLLDLSGGVAVIAFIWLVGKLRSHRA